MAVSLYHAGSKIQIEKEKLSAASDTPRTHPSRENASRAWKKRKPIWIVGKPAALIRASTAPPNGKSPPCLPKKNPSRGGRTSDHRRSQRRGRQPHRRGHRRHDRQRQGPGRPAGLG